MRALVASALGRYKSNLTAAAVVLVSTNVVRWSELGTSILRLRLAAKLLDSGRLCVDAWEDMEDSDEVDWLAAGFCNRGNSKIDPCRLELFNFCESWLRADEGLELRLPEEPGLGPMGKRMRSEGLVEGSRRIGVVPSTRPSFLEDCTRRARWKGSRAL